MEILGLLSLCGIVFAYFGYPVTIFVLSLFKREEFNFKTDVDDPCVSIVVTCRNEANVIKEKIESTLDLNFLKGKVKDEIIRPNSRIQLIVASDASDDNTNKYAAEYLDRGVELVILPERKGKESAQKEALKKVLHRIVLFTDAKIVLDNDALNILLKYFSDPKVGAVSSRDVVIDAKNESGEGLYVQYEMWVRKIETKVYSLIGLSGSCFAVRKEITENFPEGVPSDFCMLLEARKRKLRGIHADDVLATYKAVKSHGDEYDRKVRTVLRGMNSVWLYRKLIFSKSDPFLSYQIVSHKIFRWLVPLFGVVLVIVSIFKIFDSVLWLTISVIWMIVFGFAAKGFIDPTSRRSKSVRLCFFFFLSNFAILVALRKFLTGQNFTSWNPSQKG